MRRSTLAVTATIAAALLTTGCGDDDPADATAQTTPAATAPGVPADGGYKEALAYTGGKAGKADSAKSPVTVGFVNQDGGVPGWPETPPAAKAATRLVNERLGGIDGHPLVLKTCTIVSSEEDGQKCGQQMANDPDVKAVVIGNAIVGSGSIYKALAGKKPVVGEATTPPDFVAPNGFQISGGGFTVLPAMALFTAKTLKAKRVAMLYAAEPGGNASVQLVGPIFKAMGVKVTQVAIPPTSTDAVGPITAAGAQDADVFFVSTTAGPCIQVAKAYEQLGLDVPVVTTGLCADQSVSKALGKLPEWYYGQEGSIFTKAGEDPQADEYVAAMTAYNGPDVNVQGFANSTFAKVLTLTKLIAEDGPEATPAAITKKLAAFEGPVFIGAPKLDCGAIAAAPAICSHYGRMYRATPEGDFAAAGGWIDVLGQG